MRSLPLHGVDSVRARLRVPGDKSISHRALIVNAMADGIARIEDLAPGRDVTSTVGALRTLGIPIETDGEGHATVTGTSRWSASAPVDCGNAGTAARLLVGALAARLDGVATVTGDRSLSSRPMGRIVEPLRAMGAAIRPGEPGGAEDRLPLVVEGSRLVGRSHRPPVASAQVKSAILLAGLAADGETAVVEPAPSRDHTERMLAAMGASIEVRGRRVRLRPGPIDAIDVTVPGDLSSAAPFLALAAMVPGGEVVVEEVGLNPGRTGFIDVLEAFGAEVEIEIQAEAPEPRGTVRVVGRPLSGVEVGGETIPRAIDELPLVAVVATRAEGTTRLVDATELRVKESDRIATIAAGLGLLGASIEPTPDGLVVEGPTRLAGASLDAAEDHRIGMALAVAAAVAEGPSRLSGGEWIDVSYPGFLADLARCSGTRATA